MPVTLTQLAGMVLLATVPLALLPVLPSSIQLAGSAALALLMLRFPWRPLWFPALTILLFSWAALHGNRALAQISAFSNGTIHSRILITVVEPARARMQIQLLQVNNHPVWPPVRAWLYQLPAWLQPVCVGQQWQMALRLRPEHARLNEGGFDRQRFALASALALQGKVLQAEMLQGECSYRARIMQRAARYTANFTWAGVLAALAFGDRSHVTAGINQLLRETGTAHLMAISGLHITLASVAGWLLARASQILLPVARTGYRLPLAGGLIAALIYTWLSGGSPPAMRAIFALSLWSVLRLAGWHCRNFQVWLFCLALLLFTDPVSILSDSLALSALATGGLLLWYRLAPLPGYFSLKWGWGWLRLLHLQLGMLLLLMPLQAVLFHGLSLSSVAANLWAVPLVSLLTVPLILLAIILGFNQALAETIWWLADLSLTLVFWPLQRMPTAWFTLSENQCWLALLVWLVLLAWRFSLWRHSPVALLTLIFSLVAWRFYTPRPEWRVDMLDVGHGLAVVIWRGNQALLYDTGGRWEGGDAGKTIIAPWLNWHHLSLQHIILSHGHADHTGGLASLQQLWPAVTVRSALAQPEHLGCYQGTGWRWQGLMFTALWPSPGDSGNDNNHSCVVRVSDGRWQLLLTGDLESAAEYKLIVQQRAQLAATVLQVGHHGSNTSSTPPWLRTVKGQVALASAARFSPWRLPSRAVQERCLANGYQWRDTAQSGQISVSFYRDHWTLRGYREHILPRWYHQWFGAPRDSR